MEGRVKAHGPTIPLGGIFGRFRFFGIHLAVQKDKDIH
jgi:hypothetical protein